MLCVLPSKQNKTLHLSDKAKKRPEDSKLRFRENEPLIAARPVIKTCLKSNRNVVRKENR